MKKILVTFLALTALTANAKKEFKDYNEFCKAPVLASLLEANEDNRNYIDVISEFSKPLIAAKEQDCAVIKEGLKHSDTIIIDARDKATRGKIQGTYAIESDIKDLSSDQFQDHQKLEAKLKKILKKKNAGFDDPKKAKLVLFCSGHRCLRSIFAACRLHQRGYAKSHLSVILDGFKGIGDKCLHL
jgi:hypothetical protein